jgi:hypothetical protein
LRTDHPHSMRAFARMFGLSTTAQRAHRPSGWAGSAPRRILRLPGG